MLEIIKTNDGYMVQKDGGDYICDANGDNLFDWYHEAEAVLNAQIKAVTDAKHSTYHDVIDAVIAQIKVDFDKDDETAIVELLSKLPRNVLVAYLPEEVTK
jgi:hypothetical protein